LLSNDTDDIDIRNQALTVDTTPVRAPERASSFELLPDGGFTYEFQLGPEGVGQTGLTDSFEYAIDDGEFGDVATVTLDIVVVDQPPFLRTELPAQSIVVGIESAFDLSAFFEDPEGAELAFRSTDGSLPPSGGVVVTEVGVLSGLAVSGDEGTYSVVIEASDQSAQATGILALEVIANERPVASEIPDVPVIAIGELISIAAGDAFVDPEGAALSYSLQSTPESGLAINPSTGLVSGQLATSGTYELTVIATDRVSQAVSSAFSITVPEPTMAILSPIDPASLMLAARVDESDSGTISFENTGNAPLTYTVTGGEPWLSVTPSGSATLAPGATANVSISAACGPTADQLTGAVTVGSNVGNKNVPVTIDCTEAPVGILSPIDPASLALDARVDESASDTISFENTGNAPLTYTVTGSASWLSATPSGSATLAPGATADVSISAACGSTAGQRPGTVTVQSSVGNRNVPVTIDCTAEDIAIFGPFTPSSGYSTKLPVLGNSGFLPGFYNEGTAPLTYSASSEEPWISFRTPPSGTVAPGEYVTINGRADCGAIAEIRTGAVTVQTNVGSRDYPVTLECIDGPIIGPITPETYDASGPTLSGTSTFFNNGTEPLIYSVSSDAAWLQPSPTEETTLLPIRRGEVSFSAECGTRTGTITGFLSVTGNGPSLSQDTNDVIRVSLNCGP